MGHYEKQLRIMCEALRDGWEEDQNIEFHDAELLVETIRHPDTSIPKSVQDVLAGIVDYADATEEWDTEIIGRWPVEILEALDSSRN